MNIEELLNIKVSFQKNAWASTLEHELCLRDVFDDIKGNKYKTEIDNLRLYLGEGNKEKYGLYKKRLPGVTFCATFKDKRKRENIDIYNKLIVIDIDKLSVEELKRIKEILEKDKHVMSFWESPSQKGIKGLVAINYNETISEYDINLYHKHAFKKLVIYFQENYNLLLDESGSDTTRLCFLSYDPAIRTKVNFETFEINIVDVKEHETVQSVKDKPKTSGEIKLKTTNKKNSLFNPSGKNNPRDRKTIQSIIAYLTKRKISITSSYEEWFRVGYAIANTFTHEIGEKYFLKLCRLDGSMHDEIESKNILLYCYENSKGDISFSTIVYYAKNKGFLLKTNGGSTEGGCAKGDSLEY
jgi:hypothetical protein